LPHDTALIATIAAGLGLAFLFGLLAARLRFPPIIGYLVAGVVVGPYTPGYIADANIASQLAEIGVILLMFGVGLHFSLRDLLAVKRIAIPGAIVQIVVATAMGAGVAMLWGWSLGTGIVFGLSLSVASTVVLLRALEERGALNTVDGQIAVGWLIVEDLVMVVTLVLLPALAIPLGGEQPGIEGDIAAERGVALTMLITLVKVAAFLAVMLIAGRRLLPRLLEYVARIGSRELFTLAVLAIALGIAVGSSVLFDISFALGAFFAGVIISESEFSHQAAAEALPLQDAFAVLFFVSVGMLFDPRILLQSPLQVLLVSLIIMGGKTIVAFVIVAAFRYPVRTGLVVAASLGQIGEFSFILASMGLALGLLPQEAYGLLLAGALVSISLNQLLFSTVEPIYRFLNRSPAILRLVERTEDELAELPEADRETLRDHVVIVGYGRVGRVIGETLWKRNIRFVVVEQDRQAVERLRREKIDALFGDASRPGILAAQRIDRARLLVIATPDYYQARRIVEHARAENPEIDIVVRTHHRSAQRHFEQLNVGKAIMGELELAKIMVDYVLKAFGQEPDDMRNADRAARH
jgi:monovalent cation:H+ antiporter-2, CPA2 family